MSRMPQPGDAAPNFTGETQSGDRLALKELRGRYVALYFYPEDDTPVCTKQACSLRDGYDALSEASVAVVGVSADDASSHARFAEKYDLPFPLIADPERKILNAYGAWGEKNLYGRTVVGTRRMTFLIDPAGRIVHVFRRPRTADHAREILGKLPKDS